MSKKPIKMTREEIEYLDKSYRITQKILKTDSPLSRIYALRIKGLTLGQYILKYETMDMMKGFEWEIIYLTFKWVSLKYKSLFNKRNFKDMSHKFNTLMKMVEKEIPNVYETKRRKVEQEDKALKSVSEEVSTNRVEYKKKSEDKDNDVFDEMW